MQNEGQENGSWMVLECHGDHERWVVSKAHFCEPQPVFLAQSRLKVTSIHEITPTECNTGRYPSHRDGLEKAR
jgi:hypothetical protein